jgi:predicted DNA-binding transcriptional regulator YafY
MRVQLKTTVRPANIFKTVKRAMRERRTLVIVYTRENGSETVRTVEPFTTTRNKTTGDRYVRAMDRQSKESRTFRLDRITAYALGPADSHRLEAPLPRSERSLAFAATMADEPVAAPAAIRQVHAASVRRSEPVAA